MKRGERGPASQTRERVQYILSRLRKFVPTEQVKQECIKEWNISNVTYWKYWKKVEKYLEATTKRQAASYKNIVLNQLQALLPECVKTDQNGDTTRDVVQTRGVLGDIRDLLGLDAPSKTETTSLTEMKLSAVLEPAIKNPEQALKELEEAQKVIGND